MMKNNHGIQNIELISKYFYYVGLGIGILGMMGTAIISYLNISVLDLIPKCPLYEKTGYYCPGCGGTRAMIAISNGRILESLYYHPFVTYMLICYIVYETSYVLNIITHGKVRGLYFCPLYFYIRIGIVIVQCLIKNFLRFKYGFSL